MRVLVLVLIGCAAHAAPVPLRLVTEDPCAGAGAFCGPVTRVLASEGDDPVAARGPDGVEVPIVLEDSLRSAWRRIPVGDHEEILQVRTRFAVDPPAIEYLRYWPTPDGWRVAMRTEPGLFEQSYPDFPRRSAFP